MTAGDAGALWAMSVRQCQDSHARASTRARPAARHSDTHRVLCDAPRFHGILVELAKLWMGVPMGLNTTLHLRRYGRREWQHLDHADKALRDYALELSHGFPFRPVT